MIKKLLLSFALVSSSFTTEPSYSGVESPNVSSTSTTGSTTAGNLSATTNPTAVPARRMDVRPDMPNWEYSLKAMTEALNYANSYIQRKFPANTSKSGVYINHKVEIISITNVTPPELNTPDVAMSSAYYTNNSQGLVAAFLVMARITQTQVGMNQRMKLLGNLSQYLGTENTAAPQTESESRELKRYYLVSIPSKPFYRTGANNPFANPIISGGIQQLGFNETGPTIQHEEIKAMFPTHKASIKKLTEAQITAIQNGDLSQLTGEKEEEEE